MTREIKVSYIQTLKTRSQTLRKGKRTKGPAIKNAVSIDERPAIVDTRERFGDWEIDTVLGKHGTGAIVTILERKSRLYLANESRFKIGRGCNQSDDSAPDAI